MVVIAHFTFTYDPENEAKVHELSKQFTEAARKHGSFLHYYWGFHKASHSGCISFGLPTADAVLDWMKGRSDEGHIKSLYSLIHRKGRTFTGPQAEMDKLHVLVTGEVSARCSLWVQSASNPVCQLV
jgi:hypothetical protein